MSALARTVARSGSGLFLVLGCVMMPARAVELVLEGVVAATRTGDVPLRVSSRARFDFDPGAGVLQGAGSFVAEYLLPNQLTRFGHQVENLRATVSGNLDMKSYECVEGAFGARFMNASFCGNYRFGPNGLDDGGLVDDERLGEPRTLANWKAGDFDWDGSTLEIVLTPGLAAPSGLFSETALTLRLKVPPKS